MKQIFLLIAAISFIPIITAAQNTLRLTTGATLSCTNDAVITLQDISLDNDGIILLSPGDGKFYFCGSGNNVIKGQSVPTFDVITIAKTGSGVLSLEQNIRIASAIDFVSGNIDLNTKTIVLQPAAMLNSESEISHITGINGGFVETTSTLNAPANANPGNLGTIITSDQNLGSTVVKRGHQSQQNSGGGGSSILRYYDISPADNTGLNATLRFTYLDAEMNSLDENNLELWKNTDNAHWVNMGQSSKSTAGNYVEQTGLNDFSRWTLSAGKALPVTGMELSGKWKNNAAHLEWITLTEYHNRRFNIERKYKDDLAFVAIGQKPSAHTDGNSQSPTSYSWVDASNSDKGPIQYRLQQEDLNGQYAYSNIIIIKPEPSGLFIESMFPAIGVQDQLYIKTGSRDVRKMQLTIIDIKGSQVMRKELDYQSQWVQLPHLNAGNYKMFIQSGAYHWTGSFIKK